MVMPHSPLPSQAHAFLRKASEVAPRRRFACRVFNDPAWNQFVELWMPRMHAFVEEALGPYDMEPLPELAAITDGMHIAGATASFHPGNGQISICQSVEGNPGQTLEKLTHELVHASLAGWPEGDPFYEEGFVDYSVWVMAHAPCWAPYSEAMVKAAALNIAIRRERAMKDQSDYERKRWAGGLFAAVAKGPMIVGSLRMKKLEGDRTW